MNTQPKDSPCSTCNGVGKVGHRRQFKPTEWLTCPECNGTGEKPELLGGES